MIPVQPPVGLVLVQVIDLVARLLLRGVSFFVTDMQPAVAVAALVLAVVIAHKGARRNEN